MKILFIIDDVELKYFEFNKLVTNFWMIYELLSRKFEVYVAIKTFLYLKGDVPCAKSYKTFLMEGNIFKCDDMLDFELNDFKIVFFRPDPPVDIDYINSAYILSFLDSSKTLCINSPHSIINNNEKLYINKFPSLAPKNVVTSCAKTIHEFLDIHSQIVIKPLNRCFSSGVFYLNKVDKNINTIIDTATNKGKTAVMVQEFLPDVMQGDMRLIFICGEILPYCAIKRATNNDFKFNEHVKDNLLKGNCDKIKEKFENTISKTLIEDGVFLAGLDVVGDKILEINITSPCFFIDEINSLFDVQLHQIVMDKILDFAPQFTNNKEILNFSK